jgi:hypothetical protein
MKPSDEAIVIAEHALENEHSLRLAAKVGLAFPTIKERIIKDFLSSFKSVLISRLGNGWKLEDKASKTPLMRGWHIAAWKSKWMDNASIGLHCDKSGPSDLDFFVFLVKPFDHPQVAQLRQALETRYAHGKHMAEYPWWQYVEHPHRDWDTEDALVRLWQKDEALEHYASHFLKICAIAAPFIDTICGE